MRTTRLALVPSRLRPNTCGNSPQSSAFCVRVVSVAGQGRSRVGGGGAIRTHDSSTYEQLAIIEIKPFLVTRGVNLPRNGGSGLLARLDEGGSRCAFSVFRTVNASAPTLVPSIETFFPSSLRSASRGASMPGWESSGRTNSELHLSRSLGRHREGLGGGSGLLRGPPSRTSQTLPQHRVFPAGVERGEEE